MAKLNTKGEREGHVGALSTGMKHHTQIAFGVFLRSQCLGFLVSIDRRHA